MTYHNQQPQAAAFGRLCVETLYSVVFIRLPPAAAFGRLCVETFQNRYCLSWILQPPSGGCVLKHIIKLKAFNSATAAAFGRLCVET